MDEILERGYLQEGKKWQEGYVYILDYGDGKTFKIGQTRYHPSGREKHITNGLPVIMPKIRLVMYLDMFENCYYLEQLIHMHYDSNHSNGEWFDLRFIDLVELYSMLSFFGPVTLADGWYDIVPDDALTAKKNGEMNWINRLPYMSKKEEVEAFSWLKIA